jgi:hypothetical protein
VIVIVEMADWPAFTAAGEDAAIVKSTNWNETLVELVVDPLVAVTVAVSVSAAEEVQVSVEVPLVTRTTVVELREHDALPVADTVRLTVPVKVPRAATVMVDVPPGEPTFGVTLDGLASMLMPPAPVTVTDTLVEFVISLFVPPVPVIVTAYVPAVVLENVHVDV